MATSMADLGFNIDSSPMRRATRDLEGMSKGAGRAEKSAGGLSAAYRGVAGALAAVGATQFVRELVRVNAESQRLMASLQTVTGSLEDANTAWAELEQFARTTPFALTQSIQAFTKMKALGLDPTTEALTSFGNTASAMGKDLNQMIEAVADAATGEFERLKEFGIRARQEGNNVSLIFQGVETTIRKDAASITEYLQGIGEVQFAGAMKTQMDTLGGQLSNLGDSVDSFYRSLGAGGANSGVSGAISVAADGVNTLADNVDVLVTVAGGAAAVLGARMAGAITMSTASMVAAQAQALRYQATLASMAGVSRTAAIAQTSLAVAIRGASSALALVGGPAGAAVLAAAGLFYYLSRAESAADQTKRLTQEVNDLIGSFEEMDRSTTIRQIEKLEDQASAARDRMSELRDQIDRVQAQGAAQAQMGDPEANLRALNQVAKLQEEMRGLSEETRVADSAAFELQKRLYGIADGGDPFEVPTSGARELEESSNGAASAMNSVIAEIERARELLEYGIGADEDPFDSIKDSAESAIVSVQDLLNEANLLKEYGMEYGDDPFADMSESAKEAASKSEKEFSKSAERVADTLQRTIASGDWQGIGDMVGATLASSIGGKVSKAIGGDVLGPLMGGIAGGMVQLAISEAIKYASEIDDPTERRQAAQGTGTVLGSIDEKSQSISDAVSGIESTNDQLVNINTGMLSALRSLQTGISGASGGAARAASGVDANLSVQRSGFDYIPGVSQFDDLLGGELSGLLGGKSKLVDEGIQLMGGALSDLAGQTMSGALVSAYNTVAKKKHFLDDYDNYTNVTALSDSVQQQFADVFGGITESVMAGAEAIGMAPESVHDALDSFVVEMQQISLEGLSAEEKTAEIEAVFSSIFDGAVKAAVPFVRIFQEAGEGLGETLARVATEVQLTKEAIDTVGIQMSSTSAEWVARHSNALVNMVGGAEAFSNSLVGLENNFLSATESVENNQRRLKEALGNIGLPETREQYLELIQSFNASDPEGKRRIATMLKLQGAADEYYTALEREQEEALKRQQEIANERLSLEDQWLRATGNTAEIRRRELEELDPSNRYLQERIWALQDEREGIERVISARREALNSEIEIQREHARSAQEAASAVQSALGRMVMDTREVRMRSQQSALSALQASVRSGGVTAGDSLDQNLSAATAIQQSDYATFGEYVRDYTRTTSTLADLKRITERQVSTEDRMLSNLEKQLSSMDELRKELERSQLAIIKQTNKTAKILERFEIDGIEVRA